ncbi:hypothetical protein [Silvimonas iriomotensis]|uniref:Uncharacterized protein n=1 Tax=Silvimonas iriomotensis TaxID=449662 RepID=A0ABQ2P546_9NEIS|nr:hypothetical protein [Silvimonas iriomotensis]GGP18455.1 hypothetical protein GCM10010970_05070 [Silvimonas iriomotensis]
MMAIFDMESGASMIEPAQFEADFSQSVTDLQLNRQPQAALRLMTVEEAKATESARPASPQYRPYL